MSYKEKSRDTDFQNHASKIFNAICEIKPEYARKRAIWELFQNALDLTENATLEVSKTEKGLLFKHFGKPFNTSSLTALIKQTSANKEFDSNKNQIGQYGTGFLSTHVYGKKIFINSSVENDNNEIKKLDNFCLDRSGKNIEDLKNLLKEQDVKAEEICDKDKAIASHLKYTSFEYLANETEKQHIDKMITYLENVLPFIFAFNKKLQKVKINERICFSRSENSTPKEICIDKNNIENKIQLTKIEEDNIIILLPYVKDVFKELPKLYLFFPLMNTKDIGFNFLIHAEEFKPDQERNHLRLKQVNNDIEKYVNQNKKLLEKAFTKVIDEVSNNVNVHFLSLLEINFYNNEDDFLIQQKTDLINAFRNLKRIEVNNENKCLDELHYFDEDILKLNEENLKKVYNLTADYYSLPDFKTYHFLCERIQNWKGKTRSEFNLLSFKIILESVTDKNFSEIKNTDNYIAVIKIINDVATELFDDLPIIPNIHNTYTLKKDLKKWDNPETELIDTIKNINPEISKTYLHTNFYFLEKIANYNRESFKQDLNNFNQKTINEINTIESTELTKIKETLVHFIALNKKTTINIKLADFLQKEWQITINKKSISTPTSKLNYDSSFKLLARIYIKELQKSNCAINEDKLLNFTEILSLSAELKNNLLDKLPCFLNQNNELKPESELKIDEVLDEDLKEQYNEITKTDIKEKLLNIKFDTFISHQNKITGYELGQEIETKLCSGSNSYLPLNGSNSNFIFKLIELFSSKQSQMQNWLPKLYSEKEKILMYKFENENGIKQSLFKILNGENEAINLLGNLIENPDLKEIIEKGKDSLQNKKEKAKHNEYIQIIGKKIEDLIQDELLNFEYTSENEENKTKGQQNGQDFIIFKNNKPIYYIEVKSRWNDKGIIALSKRQVECCKKNKAIYAVISIDVAKYKREHNITDNNIILEKTTFEDLKDYTKVNTDLGEDFESLIKHNPINESETNMELSLIGYRGHIPQERISKKGKKFDDFINNILTPILKTNLIEK